MARAPALQPRRDHGAGLAGHLLAHDGAGVLLASVFGEDERTLRVRVTTTCSTATAMDSGMKR